MGKKGQKRVSRAKKTSKKGKKKVISPKEHVRKISYDYKKRAVKFEKKEEKFKHPLGIKVLVAYLSLLLGFYFFYLFLGIKSPIAVAFGQVIGGVPALLLIMFLIVVTMTLVSGLLKRRKWGYYLALVVFAFGILNSLISLILYLRPEAVSFTRDFLILSSVTVFVINILAILYILSEKNYFFAKHFAEKKTRIVDKVFVVALIIFLIITISIGSSLGYDFYKTNIEQTDAIISELEGRFFNDQVQVCESKSDQQKDLCFLILSIISGEKDLCNNVQSDFYKFSCLQA